ncbi:MAG: pyrroline-5-carboxylate reductase [Bdellovibrionales bacterium]|nr:pyrroline-5-carboxylate reductase [Bdellovibrionales bacterium]
MKIGILGLGKMGEALAHGIRASGDGKAWKIEATTHSKESASRAGKALRIPVHTDNAKLAKNCDVIILCVKPHQAEAVLTEIADAITKKKLVISVAASITNAQMEEWLGHGCATIRSMPNTPALIREGMTVLAPGREASPAQLKAAERIFATVGRTSVVEERLMDGVTGLSGCGPAYVYLIAEALSEAGVKVGLPRATATLLAAQTLMGAAKMVLERGVHPAALKDEVTTPAGCTIDGLMALEEGKLRVTLIKAVLAAAEKSERLRSEA